MILAAAALAALAGLWFWVVFAGRDGGWIASAVKTASTAALALTGLAAGVPGWIVAGLALGSVGDLALSRPAKAAFLAGMAAFAAGHLGYVVAFLTSFGEPVGPGPGGLTLMLATFALVASTEFWLAPHTGALRWPVRGYVLVIGAMMMAAVLLPATPGTRVLQAGAALFVASDLVLALRLFRVQDAGAQRMASRVLWPLYWGGQVLILWGAVQAAG